MFNASDDRTLSFIRERIIPAMRYKPMFGRYKIIFLDETDSMMKDSLFALRSPMELYEKNAKIIFSCNDDSNIIDAIRSRAITFEFRSLKKENVMSRLRFIADKENVDIDNNILEEIAEKAHGDLRKAINMLEAYYRGALEFTGNEFEEIFGRI